MSDIQFNFKNSGDKEHNDVVFPGAPFILKSFSYKFHIQPKTEFWRFGIRLSKTEDISFVFNGDRHLQGDSHEYKDVHISAGDRPEGVWTNPNQFYVTAYNFPKEVIKPDIHGESTYKSGIPVEFRVELDSERNLLNVGTNSSVTSSWSTSIPLDPEYKYFKIFAWADKVNFELDCTISIRYPIVESIDTSRLHPIKIGRLMFRIGDMFDPMPYSLSELIVLPASSDGAVTGTIAMKAKELGLPSPRANEPGTIFIHRSRAGSKIPWAVYAHSVAINKSGSDIISNVCHRLLEEISPLLADRNNTSKGINMPLLGTGAGRLDGVEVAKLYDEIFNGAPIPFPIIVSVQSGSLFARIKEYFEGRYIIQKEESLQKPSEILDLEDKYSISIDHSSFELNKSGQVIALSLSNISDRNISFVLKFPQLEELKLSNCKISLFSSLSRLKKLKSLGMNRTSAANYGFLSGIKALRRLDISFSPLENISFLRNLPSLEILSLTNTGITNLAPIAKLVRLVELNLTSNQIEEIEPISSLTKLKYLVLSDNRISNIEALKTLKNLESLAINKNRIQLVNSVLILSNLKYLRMESNPFLDNINLILKENENHLGALKNYYNRQMHGDLEELRHPVKVILLGNHASGKSSLIQYLLSDAIKVEPESTHILKIVRYPEDENVVPDVIYFDFGGQDYYHGFYKAFLSQESVYLILWCNQSNSNSQREDRTGVITQDFTLEYWLYQKKYIEQQFHGGKIDPLLVIQSHSEDGGRKTCHDAENRFEILNEFFTSLKKTPKKPITGDEIVNDLALKYLKSSMYLSINKIRRTSREPQWYRDFFAFILVQGFKDGFEARDVEKYILPHYKNPDHDKLEALRLDLEQMHRKGLVLYYPDLLPNKVWLNPSKFANYVHDNLLNKKSIGCFKGKVPESKFRFDQDIIDLLCLQKVIFRNQISSGETLFITPNFLPIVRKDSPELDLLTFGFDLGAPAFRLKFTNFLPFGLINKLLGLFDNFDDDNKQFWRNQILFVFRKRAKVLVVLDFEQLEIKVFASFVKDCSDEERKNITKYLFYCILAVYWDADLLDYDNFLLAMNGTKKKEDFPISDDLYHLYNSFEALYTDKDCRPNDMFISVDNLHFINYRDLYQEEQNENAVVINSFVLNDKNKFNSSKQIPISPFELFVRSKFKRRKKVVISYSKLDLVLVDTFKEYLLPLYEDNLIEHPWYCTELIAGDNWNDEIQKKFKEADIVFFMISKNSMSTKYIKENEIKNAIDRYKDDNKSVKIVPIILYYYPWKQEGKYSLDQFTALPYTAKPVTAFKKQDMIWYSISQSIRTMIKKDLDPGMKEDEILNKELRTIYEEIVEKIA